MKCPKCGLPADSAHPHSMDECIEALKKCHAITKATFTKILGIVKSFAEGKRIYGEISRIIHQAQKDMGIED